MKRFDLNLKDAVRLFCRAAFFLASGRRALFQGVFAKNGVLVWCFCGEVVVDYVVNRGALMGAFLASKCATVLDFILASFSYFIFAHFLVRRLG